MGNREEVSNKYQNYKEISTNFLWNDSNCFPRKIVWVYAGEKIQDIIIFTPIRKTSSNTYSS